MMNSLKQTFHPNDLKANIPEIKYPESYINLLNAKDRVRELLDTYLDGTETLFLFKDKLVKSYQNRLYTTLHYLLLLNIIRDDSQLVEKGKDAIDEILLDIIDGASLRCDYDKSRIDILDSREPFRFLLDNLKNLHNAHKEYYEYCETHGTKPPVRIVCGNSKEIDSFGKVLELSDQNILQDLRNSLFAYQNGVDSQIQMFDQRIEFGRIVRRQSDFVVTALDWHEHTSEVLVPDMPVLVLMTKKETLQSDHFNGFLVAIKPGQLIHINQGIVHMAPFMVTPGVYTSPVIFRLGTTKKPSDWDENTHGAWAQDLHKHIFKYGYRFLPTNFMKKIW